MTSVKQMLIDSGLDVNGWAFTEAVGISADGLVFAGNGINPWGREEGWVVNLRGVPEPSSLASCLAVVLTCFGIRFRARGLNRGQAFSISESVG